MLTYLAKLIVPKGDKYFDGWRLKPWIAFNIIGLPIFTCIGACYVKFDWRTFWFGILYGYWTAFAITAGYHRYYSHRSFKASTIVQVWFALGGVATCLGSIRYWCQEHRAHHRYLDTNKDPYNAASGLFWSHMGWAMVKPPKGMRRSGRVDIDDLTNDGIVRWQERYQHPLTFLMGFVIPTVVPWILWGDLMGGIVWATIFRIALVMHLAFTVNSFVHWYGEKTFDDEHTPRDNHFLAVLTIGEAYHNYHHHFPMDYRAGIRWYDFDTTKWVIWVLYKCGLVSRLKRFPENEVQKARLNVELKKLHEVQDTIEWPVEKEQLPVIEWSSYQEQANSHPLVLIGGFIHDVSGFLEEHPGGSGLIQGFIGKDASSAFFGGVYDHSNAAHDLLAMKRVGVLDGGYATGDLDDSPVAHTGRKYKISVEGQSLHALPIERVD